MIHQLKWTQYTGGLVLAAMLLLTGCGDASKDTMTSINSKTETYQVVIENTTNGRTFAGLSEATTRTGLNFSKFVVLTHKTPGALWDTSHPASVGIVHVAEWGKVDAAGVANGDTSLDEMASNLISVNEGFSKVVTSGGISAGNSLTFTVEVNSDYPYLSLAGMIAPSADFFTGLYDIRLYNSGNFTSNQTLNLLGYSAESRLLSEVDLSVLRSTSQNDSVTRPSTNIMLIGDSARVPDQLKTSITASTIFGTVTITKM